MFRVAVVFALTFLFAAPTRGAESFGSRSIVPIQGILDSPSFYPLRRPILVPSEPNEADRFLANFADKTFELGPGAFGDTRLSELYTDLIKLKPGTWRADGGISEDRLREAKKQLFSQERPTLRHSKRYESYRAAQNTAIVLRSRFRTQFGSAALAPSSDRSENHRLLTSIIENMFELEVTREGGSYAEAREVLDAYSNNTEFGFWSSLQTRASYLLDEHLSPNHIIIPRYSDLIGSSQGWNHVRFARPSESAGTEGLVEFEMSVMHIMRPWLDIRLVRYLRNAHVSKTELSIPLLALRQFPERLHISFLMGRRLKTIFVTRESSDGALLATSNRNIGVLTDIAFSGVPYESIFIFGVLVDGGSAR